VPPSVVSGMQEGPYESAARLYAVSRYGQALEALRRPGIDANDPKVVKLAARCQYQKGSYSEAVRALERLVRENKADAETLLWLGHGYTRLAERAGTNPTDSAVATFLHKALEYTQKARQADPSGLEPALALFELYLHTPTTMGGGVEKAREVANSMRSRSPIDSRLLLARYYEKRADLATDGESRRSSLASAEVELKNAAAGDAEDIGARLELARFLARRGRVQECDSLMSRLKAESENVRRLLFEEATIFFDTDRNLRQAEALLVEYLRNELTPEDPPATAAKALLAQVRAKLNPAPPR
jgi:tetratricopeptide (TPR) repeat protein